MPPKVRKKYPRTNYPKNAKSQLGNPVEDSREDYSSCREDSEPAACFCSSLALFCYIIHVTHEKCYLIANVTKKKNFCGIDPAHSTGASLSCTGLFSGDDPRLLRSEVVLISISCTGEAGAEPLYAISPNPPQPPGKRRLSDTAATGGLRHTRGERLPPPPLRKLSGLGPTSPPLRLGIKLPAVYLRQFLSLSALSIGLCCTKNQ